MTKFTPTPSQTKAINERGHEIVVSAAAGSGKTTVLINRIINMVINGECSVDELLIVTYTRAATAEIRSRLSVAITEKLKEDPSNKDLAKQQMLVPSASIYTIDAFCSDLVRQNFESAGVAPDFKILQGGIKESYQNSALIATMSSFYEEDSEEFAMLEALLMKIEPYVKTAYDKMQSYRYPNKVLDHSIDFYKNKDGSIDNAIKNFMPIINCYINGIENGIKFFNDDIVTCNVTPELTALKEVATFIQNKDFKNAFNVTYSPVTWSSKFEGAKEPEGLMLKYYREEAKKLLTKNCDKLKKYFAYGDIYLDDDLKVQLPMLEKFIEIIRAYSDNYNKLKSEKNYLDFSDIEHIAFNLLIDENGNKTELASSMSSAYHEILIDEYQDTNELQDAIFCALSKELTNLFIVGDVKQSIYGFRNAMPELFVEKKTHPGNITLGENFRSNAGIVDFVNFIFDQIMTKECGDINYQDASEQLLHGHNDACDASRIDTEIHIINKKGLLEEAKFVINYIKNAKAENSELSYGDFAILMSTVKGRGKIVADALEAANVPVIFDGGVEFLQTSDIKAMLSVLRTIDNPKKDIDMLATLMSPVFGFTPDDMAALRLEGKKSDTLYSILEKSETDKFHGAYETIMRYRKLSITMPVGDLIRLIYDETLYPDIIAAMPNGLQREANLLLLSQYADEYEQSSDIGIGNFIKYLDTLVDNEIEPGSASLISASTDAVKLMTIHKSKGLEFKYCFIIDLGKEFNTSRDPMFFGKDFKIGIKTCDKDTYDTLPSFVFSQIKNGNIYYEMAEKLRVLYVAMTRAKEKLILVGSLSPNKGKTLEEKIDEISMKGDFDPTTGTINSYMIAKSTNFLNIILMAVNHKGKTPSMPFSFTIDPAILDEEENEALELSTNFDSAALSEIKERLSYEYPYEILNSIPTKRSASATEAMGFSERFFANAKPEFATGSRLTAAQKGTCLHRFMQFADFEKAASDAKAELQALKDKGYFSDIEADSIDTEKIANFFKSDIYNRMKKSNNIMREKKFAVLIPAERFRDDLPEELKSETVLSQGIADCVFEENGKLIIVDYKTDRSGTEDEFRERYISQLLTYREAIQQITGMEVKECYIYAFSLDKEIIVI